MQLLMATQVKGATDHDGLPVTIFHTNDLQSRLLGFGPNADYTPQTINDDATIGGVARLMSLLEQRRKAVETQGPSLTFDAGDVMMGTLFHTVSRETGTEFQLLKLMEYDAITLGNHDFDFRPSGLGKALKAAQAGVGLPPIVLANIEYSPQSKEDDLLEVLNSKGLIKPSMLINKNGINFGVIGIMGHHAISVIGEAEPISFPDPVQAIKEQVELLKAKGADVLILLSHGGVFQQSGHWKGDDVDYAKAIPELDLIISGHSHRVTPEPVQVNNTLIVQAGSEGRFLGELTLEWSPGSKELKLKNYKLHLIDDQLKGNKKASQLVAQAQEKITQQVLQPLKLSFDQPIVEVDRDLGRAFNDYILGNLASDALRKAAQADMAITTNGEVRDELLLGKSGVQQVSDIFRIFPIGIGYKDESLGYDLVKVYFNGAELKSIMEILLFAYEIKGTAFYPRISGVQVHYNPYRMPLDKVTDIVLLKDNGKRDPVNLSSSANQLYSITLTHYAFKFMGIIGELSYGLLDAIPKDAGGKPVKSVQDILVDGNLNQAGIQKQKAWTALIDYLSQMNDSNSNGIPNIDYQSDLDSPRIIPNKSLSPVNLLRNSNHITKTVLAMILVFLLVAGLLIRRYFKAS